MCVFVSLYMLGFTLASVGLIRLTCKGTRWDRSVLVYSILQHHRMHWRPSLVGNSNQRDKEKCWKWRNNTKYKTCFLLAFSSSQCWKLTLADRSCAVPVESIDAVDHGRTGRNVARIALQSQHGTSVCRDETTRWWRRDKSASFRCVQNNNKHYKTLHNRNSIFF